MAYIRMQIMNVFQKRKTNIHTSRGNKISSITQHTHIHTLTGQSKCKLTTKTTYTGTEYTQNTSTHELNAHTQDSACENTHTNHKTGGRNLLSSKEHTRTTQINHYTHSEIRSAHTYTHTLKLTYHNSEQRTTTGRMNGNIHIFIHM
jgi:hypothetical protein